MLTKKTISASVLSAKSAYTPKGKPDSPKNSISKSKSETRIVRSNHDKYATGPNLGTRPIPSRDAAQGRLEKYNIKESLGKGLHAEVFRCVDDEGREYALKMVHKQKARPAVAQNTIREADVLRKLNHPNIIFLKDCIDTNNAVYLVLEYVAGGELFSKIVDLKNYTEDMARDVLRDVFRAIAYLHKMGYCHRDIKPENLMLKEKKAKDLCGRGSIAAQEHSPEVLTRVALVDFGFATRYEPGKRTLKSCCGTPDFVAPEVLDVGYFKATDIGYNEKCDIWSIGVLCYILISGYTPFHASSRPGLFRKISQGQWRFTEGSVWNKISPTAKDFVSSCLTLDPDMRISAEEALNHPWLEGCTSFSDENLVECIENIRRFQARSHWRKLLIGVQFTVHVAYIANCTQFLVQPNSQLLKDFRSFDADPETDMSNLDLTDNYLGETGVKAALATVIELDTIHTLRLGNNELGNETVKCLCDMLKKHPSLQHIYLDNNPITQMGGRLLLNFVQANPLIVTLSLTGTEISTSTLKKIAAQVARNGSQEAPSSTCAVM